MNKFAYFAVLALALGISACNESTSRDARDVAASQSAVAKDTMTLNDYKNKLAEDRALKADAIKRGDKAAQAKYSLAIAADKSMIHEKRSERKVDQNILEEDREDLRN